MRSKYTASRRSHAREILGLRERMTALLERTGPPLTPAPGSTFLSLTEDELEYLTYLVGMDAWVFGVR